MTQASYWTAMGIALATVAVAGVGDWRRMNRRKSIDHVGWVPWRGIQVAAFFLSLGFFVLAMKS